MTRRLLHVHRLGRIAYGKMLEMQVRLRDARIAGEIPDTLLLLEHHPVLTLGRASKDEHVLLSPEALRQRGFEVYEIGRGGDVTYHGPGQLVAYPILDLKPDRKDVRRYVENLEEVMIRLAGHYGLDGRRIAGLNGAWIGDRKIGAVGVRIRQWVTMHGFAFNVSTDLDAYDVIVPCGIRDKEVTSLQRELGRAIDGDGVAGVAADIFGEVFESDVQHRNQLPGAAHA